MAASRAFGRTRRCAAQAPVGVRGGKSIGSSVGRRLAAAVQVETSPGRRTLLAGALALATFSLRSPVLAQAVGGNPDVRWYEAAEAMRRLAQSWGDQPYGAVLVLDGTLVGHGPSRVVKNSDPDAHAEREAIRDAQRKLGRTQLQGATLYSTSRPCHLCEAAAARAGIDRMYFGPSLTDAGVPGQAR
jgi:tRNA(adenine34) deaminase